MFPVGGFECLVFGWFVCALSWRRPSIRRQICLFVCVYVCLFYFVVSLPRGEGYFEDAALGMPCVDGGALGFLWWGSNMGCCLALIGTKQNVGFSTAILRF